MEEMLSSACRPAAARRLVWAVLAAGTLAAACAHAQTPAFFKCTDAAGNIQFTDTACHNTRASEPVVPAGNSALPERKMQNDTRVQRDKRNASQMEASRLAEDAAGRAAQDRQLAVARDIAERLSRERAARNAATVSVLPPTHCDQCSAPPLINPPIASPSTDFGSAFAH
ncbi:hypothetical protein BH11PSE7_BH11PSE7_00620 [soil metagenome]